MIGSYSEIPEGFSIWVCTCTAVGGQRNRYYWPQTEASTDKGTWHGRVNYAGESGLVVIAVLLVGKEGEVLFHHYNRVGYETGNWTAIAKLTSDTILCASVTAIIDPGIS